MHCGFLVESSIESCTWQAGGGVRRFWRVSLWVEFDIVWLIWHRQLDDCTKGDMHESSHFVKMWIWLSSLVWGLRLHFNKSPVVLLLLFRDPPLEYQPRDPEWEGCSLEHVTIYRNQQRSLLGIHSESQPGKWGTPESEEIAVWSKLSNHSNTAKNSSENSSLDGSRREIIFPKCRFGGWRSVWGWWWAEGNLFFFFLIN